MKNITSIVTFFVFFFVTNLVFSQSIYNFESFSNSATINGSDNWNVSNIGTGANINSAFISTESTSGSYTPTKGLRVNPLGGSNHLWISRVNNGSFSLPTVTSDGIIELTFDHKRNYWGSAFYVGYDSNSDGHISESETTFGVGDDDRNDDFEVLGPGGSVLATISKSLGDWTQFKIIVDLNANSGSGSISVSYKDLTTGGSFVSPAGSQNLNPSFNTSASDQTNPTLINGMVYAHDAGDETIIDNITMTVCSAPTVQATSATFGTETASTLSLTGFTAPAGGADGYAIYINDTNSFTAPTDGDEPTADTSWNGSGQQPVYFGTTIPSNLQITGLKGKTTYYFQVYAYNDCSGTETYETTGLNVNDTTANSAPSFTSTQITSVNEGDTYSYNVRASDTDGDVVTITAPTLPSWLSLTDDTGGVVTTFAGTGSGGSADGNGTSASFASPHGVVVDASGNIYIGDTGNHTIRKITPSGDVTTFAGSTGISGFADGTGSAARFNQPNGLDIDSDGNIYVADALNHSIRKITPAGVVTTLAGVGAIGNVNGAGTGARFFRPADVAVDSYGNVFVADRSNHEIRKITPDGTVSAFAGSSSGFNDATGSSAQFSNPYGVAIDANDNLYVADASNNRVRKITPAGVVTTYAGSGTSGNTNGPAASARFNALRGLEVDNNGNVFVSDTFNHRIRLISNTGDVTTLAGSSAGYREGTGTVARFNLPNNIAINPNGDLFVVELNNSTVRKVTGPQKVLTGNSTGNGGDHSVVLRASDGSLTTNQSFTITVLTAPVVTASAATNLLANQAQLNGNVTSNGGSAVTERGFIYSLTSNDATPTLAEVNGTTVIKVAVTGTTGTYNETISSLTLGSEYSFVAFATNAVGTNESSVQTFTTTNTAPTFTSTPTTTIDEGNTFTYNITTNDVDGHTVTVTAPTLPSWLTLNTTPTLSLTGDTTGFAGMHDVVLRADDGNGGTTDQSFTITVNDVLSPTILEVGVVEDSGTYKVGDELQVFVQYNEPVTVLGVPQITLETGTTDRVINYDSTSSSTVYFNYTVQAGDVSSDLDVVGANALSLNGGSIKDAAGNNAVIVLPFGSGTSGSISNSKDIVIDGIAATVSSVTVPANATYSAGQNLDFTINFSENVNVVTTGGTPQLSLTIGSTTRQAEYVSGGGTSALLFRYTVQTGEQDSDGITVGTLSANGGTIKDTAGNDATLTLNSVGSTTAVLVDALPSVTLSSSTSTILENAGVSTITATLSAASVFNTTVNLSFSGTATGSGTDYNASGASITILAGATTGTITLTSVQDSLDENDETIIVDIDSVTGGTESGT